MTTGPGPGGGQQSKRRSTLTTGKPENRQNPQAPKLRPSCRATDVAAPRPGLGRCPQITSDASRHSHPVRTATRAVHTRTEHAQGRRDTSEPPGRRAGEGEGEAPPCRPARTDTSRVPTTGARSAVTAWPQPCPRLLRRLRPTATRRPPAPHSPAPACPVPPVCRAAPSRSSARSATPRVRVAPRSARSAAGTSSRTRRPPTPRRPRARRRPAPAATRPCTSSSRRRPATSRTSTRVPARRR